MVEFKAIDGRGIRIIPLRCQCWRGLRDPCCSYPLQFRCCHDHPRPPSGVSGLCCHRKETCHRTKSRRPRQIQQLLSTSILSSYLSIVYSSLIRNLISITTIAMAMLAEVKLTGSLLSITSCNFIEHFSGHIFFLLRMLLFVTFEHLITTFFISLL